MAWIATAVVAVGEAVGVVETIAAVATVVSEVGTFMTVVGAVTGNKDMMKLGGEMSMVGGIGSLAAGAMGAADGVLSSAATDTATDTATETASSEAATKLADINPGAEGDITTMTGTSAGKGLDISPGANTGGDSLTGTTGVGNPQGDMPVTGATGTPGTTATTTSTTATPDVVKTNDQWSIDSLKRINGTGDTLSAGVKGYDVPDLYQPGAGAQAATKAGTDGFFSQFSNFANKNSTLFNAGMQLVGVAMKGANDAAINDQNAALKQQQINQTSYGSAVGSMGNGIVSGARK